MSSKWCSSVGTSHRKAPASRAILDIRTRKLTEIRHVVVFLRHTEAVFEESMVRQMLIHTLDVVARARGMMKLSKDTGITRPGLYKALSPDGNPNFETGTKIVGAFGMRLSAQAA
jgi:probable addiction module antidote protein